MNKNQWLVLGIGLWISGWIIFTLRGGICIGNGDLLIACTVRRYAFVIPGLIMIFLGTIFVVLSWLEFKR